MTTHGRASEYLEGALDASEEDAFLDHLAGCAECQAELRDEVELRDHEDALRAAAGTVRASHGRTHEYLEGMLDASEEAAFLDHLTGCTECQRELHDEVQLRDREDALRKPTNDARRQAAAPMPAPPLRRARRLAYATSSALAATVLLALWLQHSPGQPIALTSRPARAQEIRLAYAGAARYRPYDTLLGSATPSEPVEPAAIADLDKRDDCPGVAAAYVLSGELVRAEERYRRCRPGVDLDADRAGLAVLRHDNDAALELTEAVLDVAPNHTVALWNRGLALWGLGLELSAAAAFERVAIFDAPRHPGWAHEAAERARGLRADIERIHAAYGSVDQRGKDMVRGGPPIASDLAQQVPWRSRLHLHDAIRTATTPARLDELAPLAAALEGRAGNGLGGYLDRARAQLSPERTAASAGYPKILSARRADDAAWTSWLALANRAHADDLILGARIITGLLDGEPSADQLAEATGDPWFVLGVALARARKDHSAGRTQEAAARLTTLQDRCPAGTVTYRCLQLLVELTRVANERDRPAEARRYGLAALTMSRQLGEWPQRGQALVFAGDAARFGGGFAVAQAYYEESSHSLDACGQRDQAFYSADLLFLRHHLARARAMAAEAPACDRLPNPNELTVLVRLLRAGHPVLGAAAVAAMIAQAQRAPTYADDAPYLDYLAEWLVLDDDPAARARLARVADRARELDVEVAMRDKTVAAIDSALFADAGRRRAWGEAFAVAAHARGVSPPGRCALAFGGDDLRFTVIAVGPGGAVEGRYEPDLARPAQWSAPPEMQRALSACDDVAVLALPPWLGVGPVLDPQTPWHYVLGPPLAPAPGRARRVVVSAPATPPDAGLTALAPRTWLPAPDELITGAVATPERVLLAISDATLVEIHSHATWRDALDAPVLALAAGANGWALDAARIRTGKLTGAPVVVLVDCAGGAPARFEHRAWGLPLAFRTAGASAVIASLSAIPDREAVMFFDAVTAELARGISPAKAVARARAEKMQGDSTSWMRDVVVFQ